MIAYIPTELTMAYVPVAGGMVIAEASSATKTIVTLVAAGLAMFLTAAVGYQHASQRAETGKRKPSVPTTLWEGSYEILVAGAAFLVWAAAIPTASSTGAKARRGCRWHSRPLPRSPLAALRCFWEGRPSRRATPSALAG